jgi:hypothetical protein
MEIKNIRFEGEWGAVAYPEDFQLKGDLSGLVGTFNAGIDVRITTPFTYTNGSFKAR